MMRSPTLALAALLLGACALAPAPGTDEVLGKALPATTSIPSAWKAGAGAQPVATVADEWLKSLNDPPLEAIVAEAIANNLDLRQAAERVRIAQQTVIVVGAQLLPQVDATVGGRTLHDQDHEGNSNSTIAFAGVGWELDVWGKLRAQRAAADAGSALDYA